MKCAAYYWKVSFFKQKYLLRWYHLKIVYIFQVRWLFNDNPVSGKDFLVSTSGNRQVLHIPSVSKSLEGKISCVAENEAGKVTCTAKLEVSGKWFGLMFRPISSIKNIRSFENYKLLCRGFIELYSIARKL